MRRRKIVVVRGARISVATFRILFRIKSGAAVASVTKNDRKHAVPPSPAPPLADATRRCSTYVRIRQYDDDDHDHDCTHVLVLYTYLPTYIYTHNINICVQTTLSHKRYQPILSISISYTDRYTTLYYTILYYTIL